MRQLPECFRLNKVILATNEGVFEGWRPDGIKKNPVEGISLAGAGTKRHDPCTPGGKAGSNKKWIIFFWKAADFAFLVL